MAEQVIDPAKPIMSVRDKETITAGNVRTYALPTVEELQEIRLRIGPYPGGVAEPDDPLDTNLLPFKPISFASLSNFLEWCGNINGIQSREVYKPRIGQHILDVTDAYLRQICLFVNSHSPVRFRRDDYPTMAYLPHDFWDPPTNPPTEEYIEDRANFIRTKARLPPHRLRALTHLFIHITPEPSKLGVKPDSALIVITPRAATIEYFDQMDDPSKHYLMGDMMNVISRVNADRTDPWLELADWKCRAGSGSGRFEPPTRSWDRVRSSQVHVCADALAQAFGYDVDMDCTIPLAENRTGMPGYDLLMWRKSMVIILDLYRGFFTNKIGERQYRPRVKRMFGHRRYEYNKEKPWSDHARQRRNGSPWLHFSEMVYRRLLPRELAQWNAENIYRGMTVEELEAKAIVRSRHPARLNRYEGMPEGAELGEFGGPMEIKRAQHLRAWLEDADCDGGNRVDRYHRHDQSVGWWKGGNI